MSGVRTLNRFQRIGSKHGWSAIEAWANSYALERTHWRLYADKDSFESSKHYYRVLNAMYAGGPYLYGKDKVLEFPEGTLVACCSAYKQPARRSNPQKHLRYGTTSSGQWLTPKRISGGYARRYFIVRGGELKKIEEAEVILLGGRFPSGPIFVHATNKTYLIIFQRLIRRLQKRFASIYPRQVTYGGMYDQDGHTDRFPDGRNKLAKPKDLDGARLAQPPLGSDFSDGENYTTDENLRPTEATGE